ncbi:hypothetical protein PAXINDRAFT_22014 [Paxillus involutus ATCC 200175]|uniref:Unplaced genomic scaffold PAXINscaffold_2277, whole genome shotgun sequence n=1 Tax=Paxillus involutus ATCC 200175 TaxID=664439 RepID=A0A0C9TBS8_PAXIN|nr:hypothetical protein PAXINDRAFT_22014 [Paxillus involutus ATCC 200175]
MAHTVKTSKNCDEEVLLLPDSPDVPQRPTTIPKDQTVVLLLTCLIEPLPRKVYCLTSIKYLVSELDITGGDSRKVGYYAGLFVSDLPPPSVALSHIDPSWTPIGITILCNSGSDGSTVEPRIGSRRA